MKTPKTIYRFVGLNDVDRLQQTFIESKLYLAAPSQFNDPFEFKPKRMSWVGPDSDDPLVKQGTDRSLDILYQGVCEQLDNFGVCCFSEKCDDVLMWSHYSEKHTGACLGFDTNNEFFKNLRQVDYQSERHDIDLKKGLASVRRVSSYLSPHSCGQPLNIVATQMRLDDAVTFGVESDRPNRRPVACVA